MLAKYLFSFLLNRKLPIPQILLITIIIITLQTESSITQKYEDFPKSKDANLGSDEPTKNNHPISFEPNQDFRFPEIDGFDQVPQEFSSINNYHSKQGEQSIVSTNRHHLHEKEYLDHHLADKACRLDRGCSRKDRLNNTYLSYCSRYKLENLLSNDILMSIMHDSSEHCDKILDEFIQLDEMIDQFDRLFKRVLSRYNCHNGYSVKWSCDDCRVSLCRRGQD